MLIILELECKSSLEKSSFHFKSWKEFEQMVKNHLKIEQCRSFSETFWGDPRS